MSISEVTVKGTYKKADGSPETGTVKFRPALWQQSGSGIDAVLDSSGSFQTKFPASDSGNWPDGLQIPYRVTVAVSSGTYVKELTLKSADSPIDLPTLFPIVSADSGGSGGGSGGGVPEVHAASHQPGGSDELPALLTLGNRLTMATWRCQQGTATGVNCTQSIIDNSWLCTPPNPLASSMGQFVSGTDKTGQLPVTANQTYTVSFDLKLNEVASIISRARIYWFNANQSLLGQSENPDAVPLSQSSWTSVAWTAKAPATAAWASLTWRVATGRPTVDPLVPIAMSKPGFWLGAGGQTCPPGELIPGLGFRTTKLGNAELLSVWQGGKWAPLSGDTGTFTVGNGTIRRVGNSVYLTATGYTPPAGFRPAQGGTAPTNVWYITVDDWPTSAPGSAKL